MNKIILIALLAAMPLLGHAASPELAAEYLQLSRTEQIWEDSISTQVSELTAAMPTDQRVGFIKFFKSVMSWPVMQKDMQRAMQELFSDEELRSVNAFMRTPLGASFSAKSPAMAVRVAQISARRLQEVLGNLGAGGDCKALTSTVPCSAK